MAGEIQVIANNDAALDGAGDWKAILQDGSLVAPGTDLTLKYDATDPITIGTGITVRTNASKNNTFGTVVPAAGITIPNIAKLLGIAPAGSAAELGGDYIYMRNDETGTYSVTMARRGDYWYNGTIAGVFFLALNSPGYTSLNYIGARSAFL